MNIFKRSLRASYSVLANQYKAVNQTQQKRYIRHKPENQKELLFDLFKDTDDKVSVGKFLRELHQCGFKRNDPRIRGFIIGLQKESHGCDIDPLMLDEKKFCELVDGHVDMFCQAFQNDYVISDFSHFCHTIQEIYWLCKDNKSGAVADYIPQLKKMSPDYWGVSICTVDGQRFSLGDTQIPFTIQSTGKPINYGIALAQLGANVVHKYVGQEPSGRRFNKLVLDQNNQPHNPMVNAGAIVICSLLLKLIEPSMSVSEKFDLVQNGFRKMTGGEFLGFSPSTFLSEKESADRNFAIGYYLKGYNCFPPGTHLYDVLDFYFQLCSLQVNTESLSIIAATLANGGICPTTGEEALMPVAVRDVLSLMHSCGMYDYSGQFAFNVGLPCKSGVSGSIMVVIPNVMGICCWSPPLDIYGNSSRGVQFCEELVKLYNFHNYDNLRHSPNKLDPRKKLSESLGDKRDFCSLLFAVSVGDIQEVKKRFLSGMDLNRCDYDGRTILHIAASQGHYSLVEFLMNVVRVNLEIRDRWNNTPAMNANQSGHTDIAELIQRKIDEKQES